MGASTKLLKATISYVMFVCLSVCLSAWNNSAPTDQIYKQFDTSLIILIEIIPLCLNSKSKKKKNKFTVKTQKWCTNISILLSKDVSILLDNLQASIQRYEVQSLPIIYCGITYYLQGVHNK